MSFKLPPTTTTSNTGSFPFGLSNTSNVAIGTQATKASGFSFGATGGGDAGIKNLSFGLVTTTTTTATTTAVPISVSSTTTAPPFGLGTKGALNLGSAATAATTATTANTLSSSSGFGFGQTITTSTAAATAATTTTHGTGFSFGGLGSSVSSAVAATTTTSLTTAPILSAALSAPAVPPATTAGSFASLSTATKTTDSSAINTISQLTYNQLEEYINKWTLELEEQEKVFIDQATQINAWDKILIGNNQKILELNDAVQKVKNDQQTLEQELEFIATQHKELEESIVPLQKEFAKIPAVDVERSQTYLLVENLDSQLKQMSEDLKEIIDNLNESGKCQDNTDPIIQIGKILNAHMSSLQWIEQNTNNIANKLDEITKMHENFKKDSERSFRSAYYN